MPNKMASQRILAIGKIEHGQVVMLTKHEQIEQMVSTITDEGPKGLPARYEALPPLQDFIDFAAELDELIEGRDDEAYWRSGCW